MPLLFINLEKIILKPRASEFLFRGEDNDSFFDIFSYGGTTTQEKSLGSLFIISHIKFAEEDLSYLISLVSSLAKREYYSEQSVSSHDPKTAFNATLRKLNEVLEEFFKNKKFSLNLGLIVISGDNVFISRLGKFRVSLARNGQFIDILNNIELFNKDTEGEEKFSNIISGKLQPSDKIFAYYPLRSITSREKQLNNIFTELDQEQFGEKIAHLSSNTKNFSCCGIHIQMDQIKEIPTHSAAAFAYSGTNNVQEMIISKKQKNNEPELSKIENTIATENQKENPVRLIPAELSVTKRSTPFLKISRGLSVLKNWERFNPRVRARMFFSIASIIIIPLLIFVGIKTFGSPSHIKDAVGKSRENIRLAQSYLDQNNSKEARTILYQSLASILALDKNNETESVMDEINQEISVLDKTSDKKPSLFLDLTQNPQINSLSMIGISDAGPVSIADNNKLLALSEAGANEISTLDFTPSYILNAIGNISAYDGLDKFWSFDLKNLKPVGYALKDPQPASDAVIYESNLYVLSSNSIHKYADATTGGTSRTLWRSSEPEEELIAIAIDGNLYALMSSGKLAKYFKGEKTGEFDLQISPAPSSKIYTFKDNASLYLTDKKNARVHVFDKETGSLNFSYDFSAIGSILNFSVSEEGSVWALSSDKKIWVIR